jgi:hypothetical protein
MESKLVWVMLLYTSTSAIPVGYFSSKDACVNASAEAVMVVGEKQIEQAQMFACVPVEGLLQK